MRVMPFHAVIARPTYPEEGITPTGFSWYVGRSGWEDYWPSVTSNEYRRIIGAVGAGYVFQTISGPRSRSENPR
jgi:hypothetical protein